MNKIKRINLEYGVLGTGIDSANSQDELTKEKKISSRVGPTIKDANRELSSYGGWLRRSNISQTEINDRLVRKLKLMQYGCRNKRCFDAYTNKINKIYGEQQPSTTTVQAQQQPAFMEQGMVMSNNLTKDGKPREKSYDLEKIQNIDDFIRIFNPQKMAEEYIDTYVGTRTLLPKKEYNSLKKGYNTWLKDTAKQNNFKVNISNLIDYLEGELVKRNVKVIKDKKFQGIR